MNLSDELDEIKVAAEELWSLAVDTAKVWFDWFFQIDWSKPWEGGDG